MKEFPEIARFLSELPGFDSLDDAQLANCAKSIEIAYYREGDDILTAGSENCCLHIIRSGAVELRNDTGEMMTRLAERDCFGFPSLMRQRPARNHSVAMEDTLVYHLDGEAFAGARHASSEFDTWFIRALADRLTMQPVAPTFRGVSGQQVRNLITRPPVHIGTHATIRETAQKMVDERVSAMLISEGSSVAGILTDRDIRERIVAAGIDGSHSVTEVMTVDPVTLDGDAHAYEAAIVMMQSNIHHLPITFNDKILGMVSRSDFMRLETEHPLYLVSDIGKQTTAEGVIEACQRLPALIIGQIEADANGELLGKFITMITDTVTRQLLRIAEAKHGPPPCDYAWVALGSQGRMEQSAKSDQDNALVLSDDATDADDPYFAAIAKIVNDGLDACGYVYCPGDVMASNPKWRRPLKDWKQYFHKWITVPEEKALMHANIFFDLRCVAGDSDLVDALKKSVQADARKNEIFLALMAKNAMN
jgi:CBS domain-containing protein